MKPRRRIAQEDGFTLVELLIAAVILVVGIFAVIASFDAVRRLGTNNESQTVRAQVAEKDLQQIISQGYDAIGLSSTPTHSTDPNNPNYYVINGTPSKFQWDLTNSTRTENLCTSSTSCTGSIAPGPTAWSSGGESGSIYRYVTWVDDACGTGSCPSTTDFKRVTVMITQTNQDGPQKPLLVSTLVSSPSG
jgi:type II secretory pathway pseudopilin PulG